MHLRLDSRTYEKIDQWVEAVRSERGEDALIFMVGNKTDLNDKRQISYTEAEVRAKQLNILFIETSAKTGFNVKSLFRNIVDSLPDTIFNKTVPKEIEVRLQDNNDIAVSPANQCWSTTYCWS